MVLHSSTPHGRGGTTSAILIWWTSHRVAVLRLACAVLALLAVLKLGDEFRRLLLEPGNNGAVDLKLRHQDIHDWFAGQPLYEVRPTAVYPPASYVLLWPFLGWLDLTPARWLWALTSVAALGWLVHLAVQQSGARSGLECVFAVLLPLCMNATGVTIGNGQLALHVLPALLCALLLLHQNRGQWHTRLLAVGLLLFALLKPTLSAPFLWIVLFAGGGLTTLALVALGYLGLTLFAVSFQEFSLAVLARQWLGSATLVAAEGGYANLQTLLANAGLQEWILWASLLVLGALGVWVYHHREGDFWILLGVTAIVTRLSTYHRVYDDTLILLPMVALLRIAKRESPSEGTSIAAALLLGTTVLAMLAPARLEHFQWPWSLMFTGGHALVWLAVLGFLLDRARLDKKAEV